ncbi:MAG: ATP-binding protein, partial [Pseudomonadota bacterium]
MIRTTRKAAKAEAKPSRFSSPLAIVAFSAPAAVLAAAFVYMMALNAAADRAVAQNAERLAIAWANFFSIEAVELVDGADESANRERIQRLFDETSAAGELFRFKLFDGEGRLLMVSDQSYESIAVEDLAEHNPDAAAVLSTGKPVTFVEDGTEKANRPDVYVESYVPVRRGDAIVGVVEVYVDQTVDSAAIRASNRSFGFAVGLALLIAVAPAVAAILLARRQLRDKARRLAEARDAAQAAEHAKAEFLATMSHEIRTPMNGVMGMAELLSNTELDGRQSMFLDVIRTSASSLLGIINDILDFSKIDAGQMKIESQPFRLSDVATKPTEMLAKAAFDKGLELMVRIDQDLPHDVVGDFGRLRQIVTNLLGNAVKFTQHGEVVVELRLDEGPARKRDDIVQVRLEVSDTGPGVPSAKLDAIFDKFTQIDSSDTRMHEGTGLGLAIAKGLAELMGGSLGARSELGV